MIDRQSWRYRRVTRSQRVTWAGGKRKHWHSNCSPFHLHPHPHFARSRPTDRPPTTQCNATISLKQFFDMVYEEPKKMLLYGDACRVSTDPIAKASYFFDLIQVSEETSNDAPSSMSTTNQNLHYRSLTRTRTPSIPLKTIQTSFESFRPRMPLVWPGFPSFATSIGLEWEQFTRIYRVTVW